MIVRFDKSFLKSLDKINSQSLKKRIVEVIKDLEKASSLHQVKSVKKLQGFKNYYRVRIGDYRLGFELIDNMIILIILISHRKDIYRKFP
jgi:mRNA interferase RelE/StbE